jgi:hypothetical protein
MNNTTFINTFKKSIKFFGVKSIIWCVILIINSIAAVVLSILAPHFLKELTDKIISTTTITGKMLKDISNLAIIIIVFYLAKFFLCDVPFICISM